MKKLLLALKIIVYGLIGIGIISLFWVYVIPGMLLWCIFRERYRAWIGSIVALFIVLVTRYSMDWGVKMGDESASFSWLLEFSSVLITWAIASLFVSAGYHTPRYFLSGWRMEEKPNLSVVGKP